MENLMESDAAAAAAAMTSLVELMESLAAVAVVQWTGTASADALRMERG